MKTYQFEKLKLTQKGSKFSRFIKSAHLKKTVTYSLVAGLLGYLLFQLGQDEGGRIFWNEEALRYVVTGIVFGLLITNNPCARGRC